MGPHILTPLVGICKQIHNLKKKISEADFRLFIAFYGQRSVGEPGPTPSPWSIFELPIVQKMYNLDSKDINGYTSQKFL